MRTAGWKAWLWLTASTGRCSRASVATASTCSGRNASGFSTSTCRPAPRHADATSACCPGGTNTCTASMPPAAIICCTDENTERTANFFANLSARARCGSQTATTSTSARLRRTCRCASAMNPQPAMATRVARPVTTALVPDESSAVVLVKKVPGFGPLHTAGRTLAWQPCRSERRGRVIGSPMTAPECVALQLLVLSFSQAAAAQAPPTPAPSAPAAAPAPTPLTLATVLARGKELQAPLPRALWLPDGHTPIIVRTAADGRETMHRFADGKVADDVLVDAKALLDAIGVKAEGVARFPDVEWCDDKTLRIVAGPRLFRWQPGQPKAELVLEWVQPDVDAEPLQAIAPNDARVAYVHQHQVWLAEPQGRLRQLTFDGSADVVYGNAAHRAEFGITHGLFWSKDGRFLCMSREDQRFITEYPYQDLTKTPPLPVHGRYPMAGSTHASVRLFVCDTTDYGVHALQCDPDEDVYWTNVTFAGDGTLVVARVNRGQDHLELVRYDAASGRRLGTLLREHDAEWVEPEHGPTFLADGRFLWWSPRSGHRHLWLHGPDGAEQAQVTKGA